MVRQTVVPLTRKQTQVLVEIWGTDDLDAKYTDPADERMKLLGHVQVAAHGDGRPTSESPVLVALRFGSGEITVSAVEPTTGDVLECDIVYVTTAGFVSHGAGM